MTEKQSWEKTLHSLLQTPLTVASLSTVASWDELPFSASTLDTGEAVNRPFQLLNYSYQKVLFLCI